MSFLGRRQAEPAKPAKRTMWRRLALIGFAVLLAMPAVPALARVGEPSAKLFLEEIYRAYLGNSASQARGVALDQPAAVRRYFSPGLASLILEDSAQANRAGGTPTLNGDPFIGRQEWQISDLAIEVKDASVKAVGTVSFTNFGKPEKLVLDLLKVGDSWRIVDIRWPTGTLRELYRKK
jgi:hypothetical protein